jgi:hypothetical protein
MVHKILEFLKEGNSDYAHVGLHKCLMAHVSPDSRVLCFESIYDQKATTKASLSKLPHTCSLKNNKPA